jgi:PKD repeat protein
LTGGVVLVFGLVAIAATAHASPGWLPSQGISEPGKSAFNVGTAMDAAGNAIVVWEREHESGLTHDIQVATHSPGGGFSAPATLAPGSTDPVVAMTPGGRAVIAWRRFSGGKYQFQIVTRAPGGTFSAPETVAEAVSEVSPAGIHVAINEAGDIVFAWSQRNPASELTPDPFFVMAMVRPAGGAFSSPKRVSPPEPQHAAGPGGETPMEKQARYEQEVDEWSKRRLTAAGVQVAIDEAGEALVVWTYQDGIVQPFPQPVIPTSTIQASARPAGGSFAPVVTISLPGEVRSDEAQLGFDAAGKAFVAWRHIDEFESVIEAATRPLGGGFSSPQPLSAEGTGIHSEIPRLAVTPAGRASVVWRLSTGFETTMQTVDIAPDGSLSPVQSLPLASADNPTYPELAGNRNGDLLVVWSGVSATDSLIRASLRGPGGAFAPPAPVSETSNEALQATVAIDEGDSGVAAWTRPVGKDKIVEAAGFDAVPPILQGVSIPSTGTVGESLQFAGTATDDWPIGPVAFNFGDGAAATGPAVAHVYSKPGAYRVTATATDGAGTQASSTATLTIVARNDFQIGRFRVNRRKGTGRLGVVVPEPGRLVLSGRGIRKTSVAVQPGSASLKVAPTRKGSRKLAKSGKLRARLEVAYSPAGGSTNVKQKNVKLVLKRG